MDSELRFSKFKVLTIIFVTALLTFGGMVQQSSFLNRAAAVPAKAFTHEFKDVKNHPWGAGEMEKMIRLGILQGYEEKSAFYAKPEKLITRAEFVSLLARSMGLPEESGALPFADAGKIPDWARGAVAALYEKEIVQGSNGASGKLYFNPQDNVKRAEIVAMLSRALNTKPDEELSNPFTDVQKSDWFYEDVLVANKLGIVSGRSARTFVPNGTAKRVEVMAVLARFLEKDAAKPDSDSDILKAVKKFYNEIEEFYEDGRNEGELWPLTTGEMELGLKNGGSGLWEGFSLKGTNIRMTHPYGSSKVVDKSDRLASVDYRISLEMSTSDKETPNIKTIIGERIYLVKVEGDWKVYASDVTSVDTDELAGRD